MGASQEVWNRVDEFLQDLLAPSDAALDAAIARSLEAGLPEIQVSAAQGAFLAMLAGGIGARRILEIGTLGGYSSIHLARALPPGGRLVTLELDARHARVASANLAAAGLADRVDILVGPATQSLARLAASVEEGRAGGGTLPRGTALDGGAPFDFVFIDADKENNPTYFDYALRLCRPGALIVIDNIVRDGAVLDEHSEDPKVQGVRAVLAAISAEPRVRSVALQTVGAKGWDGFALVQIKEQ